MNNGSVTPTASHFNQVRYSGKKHSGQSGPPILFAPPRAAHQHKNPPPQALQPERRGIAVLIQQPLKSIADVRHKSHMTSALSDYARVLIRPHQPKSMGVCTAKGSRGRPQSPLVAPAGAKPLRRKAAFPLQNQKNHKKMTIRCNEIAFSFVLYHEGGYVINAADSTQ